LIKRNEANGILTDTSLYSTGSDSSFYGDEAIQE
jgi:hypothetical protein